MWAEFARVRGSLNVGRRIEGGFALIASKVDVTNGIKSSVFDYAPHFDQPELPLEEAMKTWK